MTRKTWFSVAGLSILAWTVALFSNWPVVIWLGQKRIAFSPIPSYPKPIRLDYECGCYVVLSGIRRDNEKCQEQQIFIECAQHLAQWRRELDQQDMEKRR